MDTYDLMRRFADSWGLLAMALFFLAVVLRSLNPARGEEMRQAAEIPLDERSPRDFAAAKVQSGDRKSGGEK